jgi:hypothetical protein
MRATVGFLMSVEHALEEEINDKGMKGRGKGR